MGAFGGRLKAGSAVPRVPTDDDDLLVFYDFSPTSATWANSGSGGTLPLSVVGNGVRVCGPVRDVGWTAYPLDTNSGGGMLATAGTAVGESQTLTVSEYVWLQALPVGPVLDALVVKQAGTGGWGPPYYDVGLFVTELGQVMAVVRYAAGQTLVYSAEDVLAPGLHHVGFTLDLTHTIRLYLDGEKVAEIEMPGGVVGADWSGGRWLIGGMPVGGVSAPQYSQGAHWDVRIAAVARPADWFRRMYAALSSRS